MKKIDLKQGLFNLCKKTVTIIGTTVLALTGSKVLASEMTLSNFNQDNDNFIERFKIRARPQLLLKLNGLSRQM